MYRQFFALFVLLLVAACESDEPPLAGTSSTPAADAVYRGGKIYTVNPDQPWAEAVAIRGDKIVYVGDDGGADELIGDNTSVYELNGHLMLPGFQDAHIHPISGGVEAAACDLNGLDDLARYRERISSYAEANPDLPWITGGGWSMAVFGPGGSPDKSILDELVPDRPVFLSSQDGHSAWVNSRALEIAGIDRDTPDPPDGIIDRDPETGELVGSLQEGATALVEKHLPPVSAEDRVRGMEYARDMLHGYGITSMQIASAREDDLRALTALDERGQLDLRTVVSLTWQRDQTEEQIPQLVELRERYTKGNVRATTVKIFQDGVMENYTAVMLEPYLVPSGTRGIPMLEPEFLKEAVARLDARGFQVHIHAIGDGAIRQSLDAFEAALKANGEQDHRHHIAHLELIDPADVPRFGKLGVTANFQPLWAYNDDYVTELTVPFIGDERAKSLYPIRSVMDTGGRIAFGSDWSVSSANPFPQIETAVTRTDVTTHDTEPLNPEQAISVEAAIAAFTLDAAYINHQDDTTGSIEEGKLADLIVVDRNLLEIDSKDISDAKVLLTLFGGRAVHGDPEAL